jgi:hypothetical protein
MISQSASLDGTLRYGGSHSVWCELAHGQNAPPDAGLYMIGFKLGIKYERAVSRIVYIGSTVNLRTRFRTYDKWSHNSDLELLKQRYPDGLLLTWISLPGLSVEWLRAIEDAALQEASRQFGSYPICNRGRIDSPHVQSCAELVRIVPCEGLLCPRSLELLGKQLGSKTLGKLAKPKPAEHWKDANRSSSGVTLVFTSVPQPAPATEPLLPQQLDREPSPFVFTENVATWSSDKMRRIVEICSTLVAVPKRGKTKAKVLTFAAPSRQTRRPHTWGEVAAVQGRISAGTWISAERVWIKIVFAKELLGQAIFERGFFNAEDKSDLPQAPDRPYISESIAWCEEANAIQGELPADFIPPPDDADNVLNIDNDDPAQAEQLRLLARARAVDIAWAKESAIDRDKYRRVNEALCTQIEATFLEATGRVNVGDSGSS